MRIIISFESILKDPDGIKPGVLEFIKDRIDKQIPVTLAVFPLKISGDLQSRLAQLFKPEDQAYLKQLHVCRFKEFQDVINHYGTTELTLYDQDHERIAIADSLGCKVEQIDYCSAQIYWYKEIDKVNAIGGSSFCDLDGSSYAQIFSGDAFKLTSFTPPAILTDAAFESVRTDASVFETMSFPSSAPQTDATFRPLFTDTPVSEIKSCAPTVANFTFSKEDDLLSPLPPPELRRFCTSCVTSTPSKAATFIGTQCEDTENVIDEEGQSFLVAYGHVTAKL